MNSSTFKSQSRNPYMRFICLVAVTLLSGFCFATNHVEKTVSPSWISPVQYEEAEAIPGNEYQYFLIDSQDNIPKHAIYRHYATKILNAEGLQSMSNISVDFDPSYQALAFHQIQLIREGVAIDKLAASDIQVLQRETNLERGLYDGSLTALIHLADVREGDVIEYAYSIEGFNPILGNHFSSTLYHQFIIPVNRVFNRIITDPNNDITYKLFEGAQKPIKRTHNKLTEYTWDLDASSPILYDPNVPSWFNPQIRVSVTTFRNWESVLEWALPLFTIADTENPQLLPNSDSTLTKEQRIVSLIRMVQDKVRYLGFEDGISAYKPHSPKQVYEQRYGDCKDKSLLLVNLLREEGISAFPVLVHSRLEKETQNCLPSNLAFDHCIVSLEFQGKMYFIDPTISNQGGGIDNIYCPDYSYGLLIKPGQTGLTVIPPSEKANIHILETFTIDSVGGKAGLVIETTYSGRKADFTRSEFSTNSRESIQKKYLNFYSNLYPSISQTKDIIFLDEDRNQSNQVILKEFYEIAEYWQENQEEEDGLYCEVYPIVLEAEISYPNSAARDMPYYLGPPYSFSQIIQVNLPERWQINPQEVEINENGFQYKNMIRYSNNQVTIMHNYDLAKSYISGTSVKQFLQEHEKVQNNLSYYLTYGASNKSGETNWIGVILAVLAIGFIAIIRLRNMP